MTQVSTTPNPVTKCQTYIVTACHIATAQPHTNIHSHFFLNNITQVSTTPNPVHKYQTYIVPACHIHINSTITHERSLCPQHTKFCSPSCPCASCVPHSTSVSQHKAICSFSCPLLRPTQSAAMQITQQFVHPRTCTPTATMQTTHIITRPSLQDQQ